MRKTLLISGLTAILSLTSVTLSHANVINPLDVSHSSCKGWRETPRQPTRSYGDTAPSWTIAYSDGILTLTWHDYVTDCCPVGFDSKISVEDGKIAFNVVGIEGGCDCICPFDVTATFEGVAPGHYQFVFGYGVTAEIDLEEGMTRLVESPYTAVNEVTSDEGSLILSNGVITASCPGSFRIDVFNAAGVRLYSIEDSDSAELSIGSLAGGVFFVRMTSATGAVLTLPVIR